VPPPAFPPAEPTSNGLAIAAVVVGAVGLALSWLPLVGAGLPLVAVGLGVAGLGRSRGGTPGRAPAVVGVVLGGVGVLVTVTATVLFALVWSTVGPCLDSGLTAQQRNVCLRHAFHTGPTEPGATTPTGPGDAGTQLSRAPR
jgi:hypothetical protein